MKSESYLMRFARKLGFESIAWSLRRLHCPVPKNALVLEVGSGGNPYVRSNVLLDAYETTRQRHWEPLIADRPTVLGFVENLPFKDKAFDFVIASHVLEHTSEPELFLNEIQRVAKAGYIETPDAFMERINPYRDHRLEITIRDGRLIITKKSSSVTDPTVVELYEHQAKPLIAHELIPSHPFSFHVRYYWTDKVDFMVLNPETSASWNAEEPGQKREAPFSLKSCLSTAVLTSIRRLLPFERNSGSVDIMQLLRCPDCSSCSLDMLSEAVRCKQCGRKYPMNGKIPDMRIMPIAGRQQS